MRIQCSKCGEWKYPYNGGERVTQFVCNDGRVISMCDDCLCRLGEAVEEGRADEFLAGLV
jgi:hypothetical protein